ncbi:MAG: trehalose-6-phosphate synthase [Phycisphaerales bacterium]
MYHAQRADAGRRLVVVANRMPVRWVGDGADAGWQTSPGGLVSAIAPVLRARQGSWVGWNGTAVDEEGSGEVRPFEHDGMRIYPIALTRDDLESFYHGFSNETLWPLYHDAIRFPRFHRRWWWPYREVNERYARVAAGLATDGADVWVHDYQLQLAPAMIREMAPKARVGFFLHIPFPPEELFAKMPWRRQVLEGLLGADVLGFHTKLSAQNFSRAARQFTSAKGSDYRLDYEGRRIVCKAFPISVDYKAIDELGGEDETARMANRLRESLGGRRIILGVDRMDYTKGIDVRLRAFEDLLETGRASADEVVLMQIAVPSRESVGDYADLRRQVDEYVGRINGRFASGGNAAVYYLYRGLPFNELVGAYRAADVMMVTPFRDGMNLVAKEYCAARADGDGVLVLSEFAGAALELKQAMLVNPYDIDGMSAALDRALRMEEEERQRRMRSLRRTIAQHDVYRWADSFLTELSHASRKDSTRHEPALRA